MNVQDQKLRVWRRGLFCVYTCRFQIIIHIIYSSLFPFNVYQWSGVSIGVTFRVCQIHSVLIRVGDQGRVSLNGIRWQRVVTTRTFTYVSRIMCKNLLSRTFIELERLKPRSAWVGRRSDKRCGTRVWTSTNPDK